MYVCMYVTAFGVTPPGKNIHVEFHCVIVCMHASMCACIYAYTRVRYMYPEKDVCFKVLLYFSGMYVCMYACMQFIRTGILKEVFTCK
jgi:hypothetical protein